MKKKNHTSPFSKNLSITSPSYKTCRLFKYNRIPFIKGYFMSGLIEIGPVSFKKKIFKCSHYPFANLVLSSLDWTFMWTNLKHDHPKKFCTKFEIGPVLLEEMWWKCRRNIFTSVYRHTYSRRSTKLTYAFSSGKLERYTTCIKVASVWIWL